LNGNGKANGVLASHETFARYAAQTRAGKDYISADFLASRMGPPRNRRWPKHEMPGLMSGAPDNIAEAKSRLKAVPHHWFVAHDDPDCRAIETLRRPRCQCRGALPATLFSPRAIHAASAIARPGHAGVRLGKADLEKIGKLTLKAILFPVIFGPQPSVVDDGRPT